MNQWTVATLATAALLVLAANRRADLLGAGDEPVPIVDDDTGTELELGQGGGLLDTTLALFDPLTYWPAMTEPDTAAANATAFLWMLRVSEGTAGPDGYRTMFGYRIFDDWSDHPRQPAQFTDKVGRRLWTSAAGAYQFMAISPIPGGRTSVDTWDRIAAKLGLPDFSPASQDRAALALIDEAGAMNDVHAGRFDSAVFKVRRIWASLPGAGYSQGERALSMLQTAYSGAGGSFA